MKRVLKPFTIAVLAVFAIQSAFAQPAITIYNQQFAVVRESVPLTLTKGRNHVQYSDITTHLEPDSVILRDATGKHMLRIIEQNYRADPISEALLLSYYEGQTIDFQVQEGDTTKIVQGKIIRSGYVPHYSAFAMYGEQYQEAQEAQTEGGDSDPLIEVDGKLQFGLPGKPLFPALSGDTVLKPTLDWTLDTDQDGPLTAELAYVTGGMTWKADYNVVMPQTGDLLDLVGWVTMDNESGRTFENAKIKLMAGDVNKIQPSPGYPAMNFAMEDSAGFGGAQAPPVTEKTFDEYHLYTLQNPTTLRDRETKQVEFVRAGGIKSKEIYVYDGVQLPSQDYNNGINQEPTYGSQTNTKVWLMRQFENTEANGLGMPLPKGRMRFYRRDDDGQLEFIGENDIDHTPKGETMRVYTGNAFDVVGDRKQTGFKVDYNAHTMTEAFNISLRNHKNTPIEARVVEHLYRAVNWDVTEKSDPFTETDAHTIEFPVQIPANGEKVVSYTVHYTW
jgi:hypothetical protein